MGSSKNCFLDFQVSLPTKTKIFWDFDLGPRYIQFMKKTRVQKSHASVSLTSYYGLQHRLRSCIYVVEDGKWKMSELKVLISSTNKASTKKSSTGQNVYGTKHLGDKRPSGTKHLRDKSSDGTKHLMRQNV